MIERHTLVPLLLRSLLLDSRCLELEEDEPVLPVEVGVDVMKEEKRGKEIDVNIGCSTSASGSKRRSVT